MLKKACIVLAVVVLVPISAGAGLCLGVGAAFAAFYTAHEINVFLGIE